MSNPSVGGCPEDGPSVIVTATGDVYDVTAWVQYPGTMCDSDVYQSNSADPGGSSAADASFSRVGYFVSVPSLDNAHELLDLHGSGVFLLFPDQDGTANASAFDAVGWSTQAGFGASNDGGSFNTTGME